jgi:xylitol oxidase
MDKRTFMKLSAALLAGPFSIEKGSGADMDKKTNWAGNYTYSTDHIDQARSLAEVQQSVKKNAKLRVLGSRHSFNGIADSNAHLISIESMDKVIDLDGGAKTVTVEAGVRYGQLCPFLDKKGFALHNLASLPHISIAGACATATHGSGLKNGNLATAVSGLEIVTAKGDVLKLSRSEDAKIFPGAVVGLGAFGVVTKVKLDLLPTFEMRQDVYQNLPLDQLEKHFEEIVSAGYSVSLFTDWQKKRINEVWLKRRVEKAVSLEAKPDFFSAKLATKDLHPIAELSAENCTPQMGAPGPWYERLPHFRMGFTPSSGKELQAEYFVPIQNAVEAILAVERLRDQISPHLMISELRTVAADDLWMSMCYKQASLAIHFTWKPDWDSVKKVLPLIEKELAPFKPRPHWGKLFTMAPKDLHSRYEKLADFKQLLKDYDPEGKFRNKFLEETIFA